MCRLCCINLWYRLQAYGENNRQRLSGTIDVCQLCYFNLEVSFDMWYLYYERSRSVYWLFDLLFLNNLCLNLFISNLKLNYFKLSMICWSKTSSLNLNQLELDLTQIQSTSNPAIIQCFCLSWQRYLTIRVCCTCY